MIYCIMNKSLGATKNRPFLAWKNLLTWAIPLQDQLSHGETTSYRRGCPIFRGSPLFIEMSVSQPFIGIN